VIMYIFGYTIKIDSFLRLELIIRKYPERKFEVQSLQDSINMMYCLTLFILCFDMVLKMIRTLTLVNNINLIKITYL